MTPFEEWATEFDYELEPQRQQRPELCWRCGLSGVPVQGQCRFCQARLLYEPTKQRRDEGLAPLVKVLLAYAVFLGISLVGGWVLGYSMLDRHSMLTGIIVLDLLAALLVLVTWLWIGRLHLPARSEGVLPVTWVIAW